MLNGVFTRSVKEFRQKINQPGLEFEVCVEFRESLGLVVKGCACTTQLFESRMSCHLGGTSAYPWHTSGEVLVLRWIRVNPRYWIELTRVQVWQWSLRSNPLISFLEPDQLPRESWG
ncbi:hypothetical protein PIB30_031265 [Stylosanthes scabra]|uniref:Uncharacterized protein n=1 Tax=Stylosanthes scabra TaxID=79078 RepID=A0ABU6XA01_9FABA|nr:hypothetical protein [Stylosanthes scabra]